MRNITVFTVLVIIFNCAQIAAAQEEDTKPYTLSPSTSLGLFYGRAEEIVYPSDNQKAEMLSQLLWNMRPVFYNSLALDISRTRPMEKWGFFAAFSLKIGFPGKSGKMEDRDWEPTENDEILCYSSHDNITKELFMGDFSTGISLPLNRFMLLKAGVTLSYMRFAFSGENGQGTYPWGDESFSGKVISYEQNWFTVAPGLALGFYFFRFYAELFCNVSPLVYCIAEDHHLYPPKLIQYRDYTWGGLYAEPGFHFSFIANKRIELYMDAAARYMSGTKGKTYQKPIGHGSYEQNGKAGAGLAIINIGLGMKIHLVKTEKEADPNRQSPPEF